ncbi:YqaJ viral recombinase family nuclease [Streptomyces mirabilis]|uniref:YqaJ viral recombinase family nuclease n=1 Tax=Streptomyces mirabilis TaxID=68239 RepID=UPI0036D8BC55
MTATITEPAIPGVDLAPEAHVVLPAGDMWDKEFRALWLAERQKGLGGSDLAKLLGFVTNQGPWTVWVDKHGRGKDYDTEALEFGREMEEPIARVFSRRTGIPLLNPPGMYVNTERPWMVGNVDRLALDRDTGEVIGPVECKNRHEFLLKDWEQGEAPDGPAIQTMWYEAVGGWRTGYAAACVGGNKLRWHEVPRREDLIQHLVEWAGDWWQRHVVEGEEPPPDGLPGTKDVLAHLWDVDSKGVAEVAVEQARNLRHRRKALKAAVKRAEHRLDEIDNTMRLLTREKAVAQTPGKKVAWTWKQTGQLDEAELRRKYPALVEEFTETRTVRVLNVDAFKAAHEAEYTACRARRLYVPAKEI